MIVKIWPIKGVQGLKRAKLYVDDDNKVIKIDLDEQEQFVGRTVIDPQKEFKKDADTFFIENEEDVTRVLAYMSNEDKIKNKYISGYQCDPDTALQDFRLTWNEVMMAARPKKRIQNYENENLSFHMVQSFPEDLDISDEEVHQCGLELLEKIGKHQGIVCSHVHPVVADDGEVHGKCKHNHILINAFIQPDQIDPKHPQRIKYNDCKETYAQLQIWNDEIAIDHGLPIIRNPDPDRIYSWKENYDAKHGHSWKERVRLEIETARRVTASWDEFKTYMKENGYEIREGAHVTYTAPDGIHKIRGGTLGSSYTKESLELYWTLRKQIELNVEKSAQDNMAPPLWQTVQNHGPLTVEIPLGQPGEKERSFYSLPLEKSDRDRDVLSTYFNGMDLYDIKDSTGRVIASATGNEVVDYLDGLRRGENTHWVEQQKAKEEEEQKERWQKEEEERYRKEEEEKKKLNYSNRYRNSRTKQYYYIDLRDENGQHRSTLELLFLLAAVVLECEDGLWNQSKIPVGQENEAVFGPTDWKIQNMMDAIHIAAEEGLETPAQLDQRLNEAGAAYSRARAAVRKSTRAQEKMKALDDALHEFEATRELAERIHALPDGPEKEKLQEQYKDLILRYKKAKTIMYSYKVTTPEQIEDFQRRYQDIQANLPVMQEQLDKTKEDYRKLKKLQYNVNLAQSAQYCYGPDFVESKVFGENNSNQKVDRPMEQEK